MLRNHIWDIIDKINRNGTTIVLSSHHITELETLCSRIAFLKNGKILQIGHPDELKFKVSNFQEISLETYPGNYKKILAELNHKSILGKKIIGTRMIIRTQNSGEVLKQLLAKVSAFKESIVDIQVSKQSLDDVFITLAKGEGK